MNSSVVSYTWKGFNPRKWLSLINPENHTFEFKEVTYQQIMKILQTTKPSKAAGIDKVPAKLIKDGANEIAAPLTFLINTSLQSGIFPTSEKIAIITPLYKSGDRTNIDNYRPISVLNIISKTVERAVYNQLSEYLEENNLLSDQQYGFRRKRSTRDAGTKLSDEIRENKDKSYVTGALFMDMRKAFDTVNHNCLLQKLVYYGIFGKEVQWISSYLFHRSQVVFLDRVLSNREFITYGVPQGSILGPLLFILLINDLPLQSKHCQVLMYADDTVIYYSNKCLQEIERCINSDANAIQLWMQENCLILNPKKGKTEFVIFAARKRNIPVNITIDNSVINQPESYVYLGVRLDCHLTMNEHFQSMYKRVASRIKLLRKVRHKISPTAAEIIFNSMIQPLLFYCYPVFGQMSATWLGKFENLVGRAKAIVNGRKNWPTFETRLKRKIAVDAFKAFNVNANEKYVMISHSINTRGNHCKARLPRVRSAAAGQKLSYYQGALVFNSLDVKLRKEKSFVTFKNILKNFDF